jgi:hypothetical protein
VVVAHGRRIPEGKRHDAERAEAEMVGWLAGQYDAMVALLGRLVDTDSLVRQGRRGPGRRADPRSPEGARHRVQ